MSHTQLRVISIAATGQLGGQRQSHSSQIPRANKTVHASTAEPVAPALGTSQAHTRRHCSRLPAGPDRTGAAIEEHARTGLQHGSIRIGAPGRCRAECSEHSGTLPLVDLQSSPRPSLYTPRLNPQALRAGLRRRLLRHQAFRKLLAFHRRLAASQYAFHSNRQWSPSPPGTTAAAPLQLWIAQPDPPTV